VVEHAEASDGDFEPRSEKAGDEVTRRVRPAVEIDRPDDRLERIGQDRRLAAAAGAVFALSEQDELTERDLIGDLGEGSGVDDGLAQIGEVAFGQRAVAPVRQIGDGPAEYSVAEELEALVRRLAREFGAPRPVRERLAEQGIVTEGVTQSDREVVQIGRGRQRYFTRS
jgi:hypothetical protein